MDPRLPADVARLSGTLGIVVVPVVLGTAAVILIGQPMQGTSVDARVAEAGFWLFAAGVTATQREFRTSGWTERRDLHWNVTM